MAVATRGFGERLTDLGLDTWAILRVLRHDPLASVSLLVIVGLVLGALLAPILTPYSGQGRGDPNIAEKFQPPGREHPFGTDHLGRDLLARVLFGGRISLSMGVMVVLIAVAIGFPLGALAGYTGGWVDEVIMRLTDVFLSFPPLLLAIAIAAALGPSFRNAMLAIGLTWWPWYTRLIRAQTLSLRSRTFIDAARCMGVRDRTIIRRHVVPNVLTPVLVQGTLDIGSAILTGAALSFIGLGVQPPTADWGRMVSDGRIYFMGQWWYATFPGLAIFLATLAFNLLGDTVRDLTDPHMK